MGRFFTDYRGGLIQLHGLFILLLFQQGHLPLQGEDLLLLPSQRLIERIDGVLVKGELALQIYQLLPQLLYLRHGFPGFDTASRPLALIQRANILPGITD
jgi:hypothetical protein